MTILVTYKTKDKIYMGCDTQTTGYVVGSCEDKWVKVMINDIDFIWIGITGYAKFVDFFKYGFHPPYYYKEDDFVDYLHNQLSPSIMKALTERKITKERDSRIDTESEFLIVYDDVYSLCNDVAPFKQSDAFMATGSGCHFAYGAYHVYSHEHALDNDKSVKEMIYKCLDAAEVYDECCSSPNVIHVMERVK